MTVAQRVKTGCSNVGASIMSRKKGMYQHESRKVKVMHIAGWSCSAIVFLIFGSILMDRAANAGYIEKDFAVMNGRKQQMRPYNTCAAPDYVLDPSISSLEAREFGEGYVNYCKVNPQKCMYSGTEW